MESMNLMHPVIKYQIMQAIKSISIPETCHQSWQQMTPVSEGRHCQSCCKTVTDFTVMTNNEIINYLANKNNICGRFGDSQLKSINQQLRINDLSKTNLWKKRILLLGLLGSSIFYKAVAQTKPIKTEQKEGKRSAPILLDSVRTGKIAPKLDENIVFQKKLTDKREELQSTVGGIIILSRPSFFKRLYYRCIKNPIHKIFN